MLRGLHNGLRDIYLKSKETVTSLGGNQCFYIHEKAQDGGYITLPKTLARALGYLNHQYNIPQLYQIGTLVQQNDDQSALLVSTTTTLVRKEELVWGLLPPYAFQTMYVYSDLVDSPVVGDTQVNLFHILVSRREAGDVVAEEIKLQTYHRLRTSVFSSVKKNIRGDRGGPIPFDSRIVRVTLHFRRRASF